MPTLSRWFIKIGMLYFAIGLTMGVLLLVQPMLEWSPGLQALRPVYLHFLFIGWVTQLSSLDATIGGFAPFATCQLRSENS